MTDLIINERSPPENVAREATAIAKQGKAGRVKVTPDGDGNWRVVIDGANSGQGGPPVDIPANEWGDAKPMTKKDFDTFSSEVRERAQSRSQVTDNSSRSAAKGFWRITLNYKGRTND
jgi:hypothetical protein